MAQALVQVARAQGQEIAALAAFDNAMGLHANAGVEPIDEGTGEAGRSLISDDRLITTLRSRAPRALSAPQVSLVADAGVATFPGDELGTPANNFVGASMTLPIYDQGVKNAQTESAAIQVDLETATLMQTELGIELDVRQAFGILGGPREAMIQAEAELKTAQEVLTDTQVQYRAGITNLALLLNAQSGLTQAETDRLNAVFALRQAEQSYLYALGDVSLPPTAY